MKTTLKELRDSAKISKRTYTPSGYVLHPRTTDVIIYSDKYVIEMLNCGKFLFRPSGSGSGRRSKDLSKVELALYEFVSSKTPNTYEYGTTTKS